MKNKNLKLRKKALSVACAAFVGVASLHAQLGLTTVTFAFTGAVQSFTVPPACVNNLTVDVVGAKGGFGYPATHQGGKGGRTTGEFTVSPGQVLNIYVGGIGANGSSSSGGTGGFNGGALGALYPGNYSGGGGGGASDIRVSPYSLNDRIIVAGGGGGGAFNYGTTDYDKGGDGGGLTGGGGYSGNTQNGGGYPGGGATQGAGGVAGNYPGYCVASPGTFGVGGDGGTCTNSGGGGGGGYYGGGGGVWGGGGGGSAYAAALISNPSFTSGVGTGDGYVILSYSLPPPSLTITASSNTVCSTDNVSLTVTGASASYTWGTGSNATSIVVNPVANSQYSVVGSGTAACLPYGLVNISVIPLPNVVAISSNVFTVCPSVPVTLSGSGATSYVWTNGVTNGVSFPAPSSTTIYTVTGTDAQTGCSNTNTVQLSIFSGSLTVSSSATVCSGVSATLSASGAMSYTWTPGNLIFPSVNVSPLSSAVYTVNGITSNFCPVSNTVGVTVNPSPTITASSSKATICKGESTNLTANGTSTFLWNNASTTASIVVSPTINTVYSVNGVSNGCSSNMATVLVIVEFCTGINNQIASAQELVSVFPNPSNGKITLKGITEISLNVVNELGQLVKTVTLSESNNFKVSIDNLSSGIYFVVGNNNDGKITKKVIVD